MKCAICRTETLQPIMLENNLQAYRCTTCGGVWLNSADYWQWLEQHGPNLPETPASAPEPTAVESDRARLCPSCGHILLPYHVGHEVPFTLDRCGNCNGVWFDAQEWDVLRQRNLHDDLHMMFTAAWQRQVRRGEHKRTLQAIYADKFGAEDYAELRRIKEWLYAHPQRVAMLAYLNEEDPYKL